MDLQKYKIAYRRNEMMNFHYDENPTGGTITLEGRLTVENLSALKKSLIEALIKTDNLILDHNNADEFDFSYLQLLLSIIKTSEQMNKKFSVVKGSPENFRKLVVKYGFADINPFSRIFLS
ncbi:MAG: STAS domain-containing protein [Ignavibacteriales bacterium]|nr:MAG: STAS domain-containing protein [Ignavibacteriales bacterium]